jgi:ABC-type glycerol-3-phosphate transport system substrate-binding protein
MKIGKIFITVGALAVLLTLLVLAGCAEFGEALMYASSPSSSNSTSGSSSSQEAQYLCRIEYTQLGSNISQQKIVWATSPSSAQTKARTEFLAANPGVTIRSVSVIRKI